MTYSNLLKEIWSTVYDSGACFDSTFDKYFHEKYSQCINGEHMNREQYKEHIIQQQKNMRLTNIDYKHFIENGNELFALYYPSGSNNADQDIKAEVIAYFKFEDQKLLHIHGQVQMLQGDPKDADM